MRYKSLPTTRNLPAYNLADGRSARQQVADFDRRHGVIELSTDYRPCGEPANVEYELITIEQAVRVDFWQVWAMGWGE